jgi:nicotinamidase-related amidase
MPMGPDLTTAALIIVDMQNDFLHRDGAFGRRAREDVDAPIDLEFLKTKCGRTVNTALHVVHWRRQMLTPPRRARTSWEWRVRHPHPRQVALCVSWKPRASRKPRTHSTNAFPSPSRRM